MGLLFPPSYDTIYMAIKIIGAGLGRTGTLSLKLALEKLDLGPCYHMVELFQQPTSVELWKSARLTEKTKWDELFNDYNSVVDFPGCLYWLELYKRYHGSKVILTVRDFDSWYSSVVSTIYSEKPSLLTKLKFMMLYPFSNHTKNLLRAFQYVDKLIWTDLFEKRFNDKNFARSIFESHIQNVQSSIPEKDLLIYNIQSGWKPLCDFLDIEIPQRELFPHINTRNEFSTLMKKYY